jgi:hypothetical protein
LPAFVYYVFDVEEMYRSMFDKGSTPLRVWYFLYFFFSRFSLSAGYLSQLSFQQN